MRRLWLPLIVLNVAFHVTAQRDPSLRSLAAAAPAPYTPTCVSSSPDKPLQFGVRVRARFGEPNVQYGALFAGGFVNAIGGDAEARGFYVALTVGTS